MAAATRSGRVATADAGELSGGSRMGVMRGEGGWEGNQWEREGGRGGGTVRRKEVGFNILTCAIRDIYVIYF